MTPEQHRKEQTRLTGAATRAETALRKSTGTLADKLVLKAAVRQAQEALRQHKLNFYELTNRSKTP